MKGRRTCNDGAKQYGHAPHGDDKDTGAELHKLFVGGLPADCKEDELLHVFGTYGPVSRVHILRPKGPVTPNSRLAAFVYYDKEEAGNDAIQVLNDQYKIRVDAGAAIQVRWAHRDREGDKGKSNATSVRCSSDQWVDESSADNSANTMRVGAKNSLNNRGFKIFVGGLPKDCVESELQQVFSTYGEVTKIHLMSPHAISGRVAAFVFYKECGAANDAIEVLHGIYKIRKDAAEPIQVKWAHEKDNGKNGETEWEMSNHGANFDKDRREDPNVRDNKSKPNDKNPKHRSESFTRLDIPAVVIENLPEDITEEVVGWVFEHYGNISRIKIKKRGKAIVTFENHEDADRARMTLDGKYEIREGTGPISVKPLGQS